MAKKQTKTLKVTNSCHADWDRMTATEQGKHCSSCNKTVIDFTKYTDKELVEFFKNVNGNVCGRFENYQLNRSLPITQTNSNSFFYRALFGSAIAATIATGVKGQDVAQNTEGATPNGQPRQTTITIKKKAPSALTVIKGKVIDKETKQSIGWEVSIVVSGMDIACETDSAGFFSLPLTDDLKGKKIKLHAAVYGYKEKEITISAGNQLTFQVIALKKNHYKAGSSGQTMGNTRFL